MATVQLSGARWAENSAGRFGPYQDDSGNLWIVTTYLSGIMYMRVYKSTDGGATWSTHYDDLGGASNTLLDSVFDSANGVIYMLISNSAFPGLVIKSFTISNTTWSYPAIGGTAPVSTNGWLTLRSTGEFVVFYQGPTHQLMGTPYRTCYYSRALPGGNWAAGVEVSGAVKLHHYDAKSACLGASDRMHMFFVDSTTLPVVHRSVSSANVLDTAGTVFGTTSSSNFISCYYDSILNKVVVGHEFTGALSYVYRATSGGANPQTWTQDANSINPSGAGNDLVNCSDALIYEPSAAKLYAFYRDATSDDIYQNSAPASGTTWETATLFAGSDQQESGFNSLQALNGGSGTFEQIAQSFTPSKDLVINSVSLGLRKGNSPSDNIFVDICSDNYNQPGTVLSTSNAIVASSLTTSVASIPFFFSTPLSLVGDTKYWLVLRRSGARDTSNLVYWGYPNSSSYTRGDGATKNNGTWSIGSDYNFSVPMDVTVTGISVGLITDAIGVVFNNSGTVYFDKLSLVTAIPPTTQQEEFFALL